MGAIDTHSKNVFPLSLWERGRGEGVMAQDMEHLVLAPKSPSP